MLLNIIQFDNFFNIFAKFSTNSYHFSTKRFLLIFLAICLQLLSMNSLNERIHRALIFKSMNTYTLRLMPSSPNECQWNPNTIKYYTVIKQPHIHAHAIIHADHHYNYTACTNICERARFPVDVRYINKSHYQVERSENV